MPDFRIPLAGSYNTRITQTNSLSSASGIVGLGIVGIMIVGKNIQSTDKDQRFLNCFTETVKNPFTQGLTLYCVKRPGFSVAATPAAGSIGTAVMVWTGQGAGNKVITAFGGTNSTIYDSAVSLGAMTGMATKITETFVSNVATLVMSSTDNTAWYYDTGVAITTKITNGDFPGNAGFILAGGFAHMDGYPFIMTTDGKIWNGDVNSVTAWTAGNFVSANSYPDRGIGCVRQRDKIMAFGTESVQFFYNAANPTGSPLARIESMTLRVGCISADAIAQAEDSVYWCGSSPQGGLSVYQYGAGLRTVSTPEIDAILILAGAANISLTSLKIYGRNFVIVNASTVNFIFCVEENAWHEWNTASGVRRWYKCAGVSSGSTQVIYAITNTLTSGKIYTINPSSLSFQDDAETFTARIQTSKLGDGTKRQFWDEVNIIGDQEVVSSPTTISASSDDYQTYDVIGTVDLMDNERRVTRCGSDYRRAWVITNSANTPMRLEALAGSRTLGIL